MAERGVAARDAPPVARRPSFRKTLRENENALAPEYLDALEQKRKQLDESIHKYIAAKEREYKQYERDLKQQARNGEVPAGGDAGGSSNGASKRRTTTEPTLEIGAGDAAKVPARQSAVEALMSVGQRRDVDPQAVEEGGVIDRSTLAGLTDRRTSEEREKEFIGLFTPPYLPAIDSKAGRQLSESAPSRVDLPNKEHAPEMRSSLVRSESDTAAHPRVKRPVHLQLASRTSSSGSSADGKLASAMKSTTPAHQRPKRKRVSLAVGDSIVAPSDSVPSGLSISSTPSHSRTRSPETERVPLPLLTAGPTATLDFATQKAPTATVVKTFTRTVGQDASTTEPAPTQPSAPAAPTPTAAATNSSTPRSPSKIDADGDLFDLDEEDDALHQPADDFESAIESEDDTVPGLAGRLHHGIDPSERTEIPMSSPGLRPGEKYAYDPEGGLVPEPENTTHPAWDDSKDQQATHLEHGPGPGTGAPGAGFSASSSKQPTSPGFRRPSVVADPRFRGQDYVNEEQKAATDELYGSAYSRPGKGSFTGGSLGESYMAKHAESMMKTRVAKEQEVR